jgi:hypothetical protein
MRDAHRAMSYSAVQEALGGKTVDRLEHVSHAQHTP